MVGSYYSQPTLTLQPCLHLGSDLSELAGPGRMSRGGLTSSNVSQVEGHYQKWQEVKHRQREEEHRILQQKLALQHQLIAAVDARSHQRHQELVQKQAKEREAQRQEKKQRDEELVKKGKESIVRGRKSQALPGKNTPSANTTDDRVIGTNKVRLSQIGGRLSAIPSREGEEVPYTASSAMSSAGGDANRLSGRDRRPIEARIKGWAQLPPHKQELYRLFGPEEAECFLHPKIMPEKKRVIQVPNALRKQGGRAGADPLWHLLRGKSHLKLEQADSQIPLELKKAYSAYIREYLTHTKPASRKQFYTDRDLPPSERVEDSRFHEHVREIRHRTEMMYRSSVANEDKTTILMHDNPMPDFNDLNGGDGIQRYHPSWADQEEAQDSGSDHEQDYQKWLPPLDSQARPDMDEPEQRPRSSPASQQHKKEKGGRGKRHHRSHRGQKLCFLTEEEAMSEGQFWRNRRDPNIPEPSIPGHMIMGEVAEDDCSQYESNLQDLQETNTDKHGLGSGTVDTKPPREQNCSSVAKQAKWQPLTLSALGEHRHSVDLPGSRDFRFGQPMTWKPIVANSSSLS